MKVEYFGIDFRHQILKGLCNNTNTVVVNPYPNSIRPTASKEIRTYRNRSLGYRLFGMWSSGDNTSDILNYDFDTLVFTDLEKSLEDSPSILQLGVCQLKSHKGTLSIYNHRSGILIRGGEELSVKEVKESLLRGLK